MKQCVSLDIMADHIGVPATARLVQQYGGLDVHIPKHKRGALYNALLTLLGADTAHELMRVFGGEHLYIAKDAKAARAIHQSIIAEHRAKGQTWGEVASTYTFKTKFSERWVRKLGGEPSQHTAHNQSDLFDAALLPPLHPLDALSRRN